MVTHRHDEEEEDDDEEGSSFLPGLKDLAHAGRTHPLNIYEHTISIPIDTCYQHLFDTSCQHTLSSNPLNTYRQILSIHSSSQHNLFTPLNTYQSILQHSLTSHPLNTLS